MNEQQGKEKEQNNELHNSLSDMTITKNKKINNPMIYSGDTKDLSALLSKNSSPALKELLNKKVMDKYGLGKENTSEPFVVNDETVARFSHV